MDFLNGSQGCFEYPFSPPRTAEECAYAFTRRWCVLGIFMSSRYLATVRRVT